MVVCKFQLCEFEGNYAGFFVDKTWLIIILFW